MRFRFFTFILCILYAIVLTAVLLYVRFPSAAFKEISIKYLESFFPGTECTITSLGYGFPLSIEATGIRLRKEETPAEVIVEVAKIDIQPKLNYPLREMDISGEMYKGDYSATLILGEKWGRFTLDRVRVEDIDLGQLAYLHKKLGRQFSGTMALAGQYKGEIATLAAGDAKGELTIRQGALDLLQPILSLSKIDLEKSDCRFQLKEYDFQIDEGSFTGKELQGDFVGNIEIDPDWLVSDLDLRGELAVGTTLFSGNGRVKSIVSSLQKQYKRDTIPFIIGGSVLDPLFRFGKQ